MTSFSIPENYPRIKIVGSFEELATTKFADGINALCWRRELRGNFAEVVEQLGLAEVLPEGITTLDAATLQRLELSDEGKTARAILLKDLELLSALEREPCLDYINGYARDETSAPIATDVFSFHADSAPIEADTFLCTYHGPSSEGLRNEDALKLVDDPKIRTLLLREFGGPEGEAFRAYLNEHCYDLHYKPVPSAVPFPFGFGNLWRIAVEYPDSPVPPCIHRAPITAPGQTPRLLLIS